MSAIFGIFQTDGRPIGQADADKMLKAMSHWQPDRSDTLLFNHVMLGHCLLFNTPESLQECLPREEEGVIITADCRLDNRDEILPKLSSFRFIDKDSTDPDLILGLYLKYGRSCLDHLIGDFVFAMYDKRSAQLFCARDHIGVKPFYYYHKDGIFAFSSEKKGILSLPYIDQSLNEKYIYQLMADIEPPFNRTFYEHLYSLWPAHSILVDGNGHHISRYWELRIPPVLKLKRAEEYYEGLHEQLTRSVSCRLRSIYPIATELSGGLDSSGMTGLAAKNIGDPERLYTFSNVMPVDANGKKEYADEEEFIDEVIRFNGIRNPIKNLGSDWSHFMEPIDAGILLNSGVDYYDAWWQDPLRKKMNERGIRVTISGFPGDQAVTNSATFYHHDLIAEGHFFEFLKIALKKKQYYLPFKKLGGMILPDFIDAWLNPPRPRWSRRDSYLADQRLDLDLLAQYQAGLPPRTKSYKSYVAAYVTDSHVPIRMQTETLHGQQFRLESRYPMADIRLLSYWLSMPVKYLGHPTVKRYAFRQAMEDVLPEKVRWRDDKGGAAGIHYWAENRRYANHFRDWIQERSGFKNTILEKLDVKKILRGYDDKLESNYKDGVFTPGFSPRIIQLMRFFDIRQ